MTANTPDDETAKRQGGLWLIIIVLPIAALVGTEKTVIPQKQNQLRALEVQLTDLQAHNMNHQAVVEEINKLDEELEQVQEQVREVGKLNSERLLEIRAIDILQDSFPERAWLLELEINNGRLRLSGFAVQDVDITTIMERLSQSALFSDVNLVSAVEQMTESGSLRRFEISCRLRPGLGAI